MTPDDKAIVNAAGRKNGIFMTPFLYISPHAAPETNPETRFCGTRMDTFAP